LSENLVAPASNPDLWIRSQELWPLDHRGGPNILMKIFSSVGRCNTYSQTEVNKLINRKQEMLWLNTREAILEWDTKVSCMMKQRENEAKDLRSQCLRTIWSDHILRSEDLHKRGQMGSTVASKELNIISLRIARSRHTRLQFCLWFCMGVKLGLWH
jgi:hypothetical protein